MHKYEAYGGDSDQKSKLSHIHGQIQHGEMLRFWPSKNPVGTSVLSSAFADGPFTHRPGVILNWEPHVSPSHGSLWPLGFPTSTGPVQVSSSHHKSEFLNFWTDRSLSEITMDLELSREVTKYPFRPHRTQQPRFIQTTPLPSFRCDSSSFPLASLYLQAFRTCPEQGLWRGRIGDGKGPPPGHALPCWAPRPSCSSSVRGSSSQAHAIIG